MNPVFLDWNQRLSEWIHDLLYIHWLIDIEINTHICVGMCERIYIFSLSLSVVVQSFSCIQLFVTPWTAAHQAPLLSTISWSLLKFMSFKSVMPSNELIFCHPLLLLPSILPSIRIFSNESVLHIRWPNYWSSSFSISPSNEYSGLISFRIMHSNQNCLMSSKT